MMTKTFLCAEESDMQALGRRFASAMEAPVFAAMHGDLGAGKTAFVRGMGEFLGATDITSPTFTIVQEYDTEPRLLHFDAYRLADEDELYAMGFEDYLAEKAFLVMEWAELVADALPDERFEITIQGSGCEVRGVEISALGARYERMLENL